MEDNKTYFGELGHGLKTLAVGMKTSWKEYWKDFFTNKSTEQYPENRKTTLHVAKRHRGRLVFKRDENGAYKCTACTLCEKACPNGTIKIVSHMAEDPETGTWTRRCTTVARCPTCWKAAHPSRSERLIPKPSKDLWQISSCSRFSLSSSSARP